MEDILKKRPIVWLVVISRWFSALWSSSRVTGAACQLPRPMKTVMSRPDAVPSSLLKTSPWTKLKGRSVTAKQARRTRRIIAIGTI